LLNALRQGYPDALVDVLAEKRNAGVYEIGDLVSEIHCYDSGVLGVQRRLQSAGYDILIDTEQIHHLSTIFANSLRPKYLCGFDTLGRRRFQTHTVPYREDRYEAISFLQLAEAVLGSPHGFDPDQPFIIVRPAAKAWAATKLKSANERQVVAVAATAGGSARLWPVARYAEVVRWLASRGYYVVLLGGSDGVEAANFIAAHMAPDAVLNLTGKTTLVQSAALLQHACLSVSADTGVMHLAYGVGTSTVSLFGSSSHRKWGPPGRRHRVVRKGLACSPCIRFGRLPPCPHNIACMQEIDAAEVIAAIEDLFDP